MSTYTIENLRVILPSKKVAEKNPDRVFSIVGTRFVDETGNELTMKSKVITRDMVNSGEFAIDLEAGTLTLTDNRKGRRPSEAASTADILAAIAAAKDSD